MKKIIFVIIGILFFTSLCFAENYYAITEHRLRNEQGNIVTDREGNKFAMQTITKTFDENTCNKVAKAKGASGGVWFCTGSFCVKGSDGELSWDKKVSWMFDNLPNQRKGIYISFTNRDGYQTRIKYVYLAGPKYPIQNFPGDVDTKDALPLAQAVIKNLEAGGIKDAKIIYSTKKE